MGNKLLGVMLLIALLISWVQTFFLYIVGFIALIIIIRLLADLYWWLRRDKEE